MILLDGKQTAATIRRELAERVQQTGKKAGRPPGLAVILVGEDPGSRIYVRNKEKACAEAGIESTSLRLDAGISQTELEARIRGLNADKTVDGILVQLPLPPGLDAGRCLDLIDPDKDVDGFHPVNVGRLTLGMPGLRSCTPAGVMELLRRYNIDPAGKKAVVIGRSNIVGKPLSLLLLHQNATVTICHSRTANLAGEVRSADLVVAALGRPGFVQGDMIKPGAVVVDVGINRTESGITGDCDFESVKEAAGALTPVPGGVGPMTIAQLLLNTVDSFQARTGIGLNRV
ncbi:MAG: bifunctional methylenetetrahydrofolate dehydrogenase/methenyltetrahydrofolate cyclohydrolase FolD [Desulfonatronovibrionaceae bacterium]